MAVDIPVRYAEEPVLPYSRPPSDEEGPLFVLRQQLADTGSELLEYALMDKLYLLENQKPIRTGEEPSLAKKIAKEDSVIR